MAKKKRKTATKSSTTKTSKKLGSRKGHMAAPSFGVSYEDYKKNPGKYKSKGS